MKSALFDRIEAHPVLATAKLEELPLPHEFVVASRIESLMPAQQLAVDAGLLFGKDLLVVAATASGKTFIGEMAGMKNYLGPGQDALFGAARGACEPEIRTVHRTVQRLCEDRPPDRRLAPQSSRDPESRRPEPAGADRCRYLRRGGQHDPVRPADAEHRDGRHRRSADARGPGTGPPARRPCRTAQVSLPLRRSFCISPRR